jgi:hypothetical protein
MAEAKCWKRLAWRSLVYPDYWVFLAVELEIEEAWSTGQAFGGDRGSKCDLSPSGTDAKNSDADKGPSCPTRMRKARLPVAMIHVPFCYISYWFLSSLCDAHGHQGWFYGYEGAKNKSVDQTDVIRSQRMD